MRDLFPGYYPPQHTELNELLQTATIIFDTSVLLRFYSFTEKTVSELFDILTNLKEAKRLWVPWWVCNEYHNNLYSTLWQLREQRQETLKNVNNLLDIISSDKRHPHVTLPIKKRVITTLRKLRTELEQQDYTESRMVDGNETRSKLADILQGCIGDKPSAELIKKISDEGIDRYARKVPPGYEDAKKPDPRKYGDLIIWKSILEYSVKNGHSVIFVTEDTKDDWFLKHDSKAVCPRPELVCEFSDNARMNECKCSIEFHCYTLNAFLLGWNSTTEAVSNDVIDETKTAMLVHYQEASSDIDIDHSLVETNVQVKRVEFSAGANEHGSITNSEM